MKTLAVLALALVGCAGGSYPNPCSTTVETDRACARALASLRADKAAGVACETAKAKATKAEPLCALEFKCPKLADPPADLDGGAE